MIGLIDYGAGNLRSVENAFAALGASTTRVASGEALAAACRIVLPGVGHFAHLMRGLDSLGLRAPLLDRLRSGVPFLGICLGMQALFEHSAEAPGVAGLGVLAGQLRRLPPGLRVPHMGWSEVERRGPVRALEGTGERPSFYFAHSYYCPAEGAAAICRYGQPIGAVIEAGALWGVQFHPEKSGSAGLRVLENFLAA